MFMNTVQHGSIMSTGRNAEIRRFMWIMFEMVQAAEEEAQKEEPMTIDFVWKIVTTVEMFVKALIAFDQNKTMDTSQKVQQLENTIVNHIYNTKGPQFAEKARMVLPVPNSGSYGGYNNYGRNREY